MRPRRHPRGRFRAASGESCSRGFRNKRKSVPAVVPCVCRLLCEWQQQSFLIVLGRLTSSAREENLHEANEGGAHQERSSRPRPRFVSGFAFAAGLFFMWWVIYIYVCITEPRPCLPPRWNYQQREFERPCHIRRDVRGGQSSHRISRDSKSGAGEGRRKRARWHWG